MLDSSFITEDLKHERNLRREEKVARCGEFHSTGHILTGKFLRQPHFCNLPKFCEVCMEKYVLKNQQKVAGALFEAKEKRLYLVQVNKENAKVMLEVYRKHEYLRFPTPEGYAFFVETQPSVKGLGYAVESITMDNFLKLERVIFEGRGEGKQSGSLYQKPVEEKNTYKVDAYTTNADTKTQEEAYERAYQSQVIEAPQTIEEAVELMNSIIARNIELLRAVGFEVTETTHSFKLEEKHSVISWDISHRMFLEKAQKELSQSSV